jgi:predicted nucleic acid-binding protein
LAYVIDASVVLKWFLREEDSEGSDALFDAFLSGKIELLAPDVLLLEVANTLWKYSALFKQLRSVEATAIFHDFLTLPLKLCPADRLASGALELAIRHRHPVYDTLYCALAIDNDCEFITADRVLVAKLQEYLPFVRYLSTIRL